MQILSFTDIQAGMNSYAVQEGTHCFFIDPVLSDDIKEIIHNYIVDFAVLTHEHYDHIRGVNEIKKAYPQIVIWCSKKAIKGLSDPSINMSRYLDFLNAVLPFGNGTAVSCDYTCSADKTCEDQETTLWEGHQLLFKETPGHSAGSLSVLLDNLYLFSGDTIFKKYPTATRLPGGSTKQFRQITEPWLNSLPQDVYVYPGHADPFLLKERYKS